MRSLLISSLLLAGACAGHSPRGDASPSTTPSTDRAAISAPTRFLEAGGARYAYRRIGPVGGIPLICLQHTRGTLDHWDPALLDGLALGEGGREVIIFDNRGVGASSGTAPDSFAAMAADAAEFIHALGYRQVDLLGFSTGGAVAQELLFREPGLVRRAILAGTAPRGGEGVNALSPRSKETGSRADLRDEDFLYGFFTPSEASQAAGRAFLARRKLRTIDPEPPVSLATARAQATAREAWGSPLPGGDSRLAKLAVPVLVANGSDDIRMRTINSYRLYQAIPGAKLILYPDSGHGFLFQYPESFARDATAFLGESR